MEVDAFLNFGFCLIHTLLNDIPCRFSHDRFLLHFSLAQITPLYYCSSLCRYRSRRQQFNHTIDHFALGDPVARPQACVVCGE